MAFERNAGSRLRRWQDCCHQHCILVFLTGLVLLLSRLNGGLDGAVAHTTQQP